MSLLSRGRDTATVYPVVRVDDGYGGSLPGVGAPVVVRCTVQPLGGTVQDGWAVSANYRLIAEHLPAGPWSRVEWRGEVWSVEGEIARWTGSRRITYDVATITRRGKTSG